MSTHKSDTESRDTGSGDDDQDLDGEVAQGYISSANSTPPPPTAADSDRWQYHIEFQTFTKGLQAAANAVFPNDTRSRYSKVSVLMLNWADEDPRLPVSLEMDSLYEVFHNTYGYETERWSIPDENCHYELSGKIMDFVKPGTDSKTQLKIVYYAGHARLLETRLLVWTSWRNNKKAKCPIVKWGGIQTILEEAPNDVLILLDCCASGTANASEGSGVNELISACAFNEIANGVGPYSFTSALVTELRLLSPRPSFSVGELYKRIFFRTQCRMPEELYENGTERERHPAPIHLVLTQAGPVPRGIQLPGGVPSQYPGKRVARNIQSHAMSMLHEFDGSSSSYASELPIRGAVMSTPAESSSSQPTSSNVQVARQTPLGPKAAPRLIFAVRLRETFKPGEDMVDHFTEWIRGFPTIADEMKIEAAFDSLSTIMIMSLPVSIAAYLPRDPAIMSLGPIISENRIPMLIKSEESGAASTPVMDDSKPPFTQDGYPTRKSALDNKWTGGLVETKKRLDEPEVARAAAPKERLEQELKLKIRQKHIRELRLKQNQRRWQIRELNLELQELEQELELEHGQLERKRLQEQNLEQGLEQELELERKRKQTQELIQMRDQMQRQRLEGVQQEQKQKQKLPGLHRQVKPTWEESF